MEIATKGRLRMDFDLDLGRWNTKIYRVMKESDSEGLKECRLKKMRRIMQLTQECGVMIKDMGREL